MKSFIIAVIIILTTSTFTFADSTIMYYWRTDTNEIVTYTVTINEENVGTVEMTAFNNALTVLSRNSEFSNLKQFEQLVNRNATGFIKDFAIVEVTVDEK